MGDDGEKFGVLLAKATVVVVFASVCVFIGYGFYRLFT